MIIDCKSIAQKYKDMAKAKINRMWNEKNYSVSLHCSGWR